MADERVDGRADEPGNERDAAGESRATRYWRANLRIVLALLTVWFAASFGAGILLAPRLDAVRLPGSGFKLGFWFAQQGSIVVFVLLIFIYAVLMNRLDRRHDVDE